MLFPLQAVEEGPSFWVWQRTLPPVREEVREWRARGLHALYWHGGTLVSDGVGWRWGERVEIDWQAADRAVAGSGIEIVPVVRLELKPGADWPSDKGLFELLDTFAAKTGARKIEVDYEAPDRLLPTYAAFLREWKTRGRSVGLSISALAHWAGSASLFRESVEEIVPMFYDLSDLSHGREQVGKDGFLPPLAGPDLSRQIAAWKGCPVPWRAGLPNFSRLTLLSKEGESRGSFRKWDWGGLLRSPFLDDAGRVAGEGVLFGSPIAPGERIVLRFPDAGALASGIGAARAAGASGVLYFRLPGAEAASGYSLPMLQALGRGDRPGPHLGVAWDEAGRIVLKNDSEADLMPFVGGSKEVRFGYTLEVEASLPFLRGAVPGDFATASKGGGLESRSLSLRFGQLPSGAILRTGFLEHLPPSPGTTFRWRIPELDSDSLWHPFD
ncbi:hypothetical protein [Verrucomicrobium sp. GAS474]|uniref:hypothetical protein n=1 Tax=Verrucomicrobium sp. GAS474 TaxID=1882831 RepID=UPI0012FF5FAF|nr:hypothetical protein [Verrucomicrobium sp. GAS474]